ncbi:MAG: TlpA family protein disulfide reductase, partial [Planctomycetota bacterium]
VVVDLKTLDEKGLAQAIEAHRGQVVLVDHWATWCIPCRELFPHTVELHRELSGRGLAVISVSHDEPDQRETALKFLQEQGAIFENYLSPYGVGSRGVEAFQVDALPHVNVYDREGRLAHSFTGGSPPFTHTEVADAVQRLLSDRNDATPTGAANRPQP